MWQFLKRRGSDSDDSTTRRPMRFADLVEEIGPLDDLRRNNAPIKFWLPEPAYEALKEVCERASNTLSFSLRRFLLQHCYGIYAWQVMVESQPDLARDQNASFSIAQTPTPPGKVRVCTYWVPELGKNVMPVKLWIPIRLRSDLEVLAEHSEVPLSQYLREIVISRLLGHGMLPKRPTMLTAVPLPAAEDWCNDKEVPLREVSWEEFRSNPNAFVKEHFEDA